MHSVHRFGYKGEENTCLWCGRKLPRPLDHFGRREDGRSDFTKKVPAKERVPQYDKPGVNGDGCFCTEGCGYQFGKKLAALGHRLKPPVVPNKRTPLEIK